MYYTDEDKSFIWFKKNLKNICKNENIEYFSLSSVGKTSIIMNPFVKIDLKRKEIDYMDKTIEYIESEMYFGISNLQLK